MIPDLIDRHWINLRSNLRCVRFWTPLSASRIVRVASFHEQVLVQTKTVRSQLQTKHVVKANLTIAEIESPGTLDIENKVCCHAQIHRVISYKPLQTTIVYYFHRERPRQLACKNNRGKDLSHIVGTFFS